MGKPIAIADSSFLIYLSRFEGQNVLGKLSLLFDHLLIPQRVLQELIPKENHPENQLRNRLVSQIRSTSEGFYRLCTSLDQIIFMFLKDIPKVDEGEAEVIAQSQIRGAKFILMDDQKAVGQLLPHFQHFRYYSSLTIICLLDLGGYMPDFKDRIRELYHMRPFNSRHLRSAYIQAAEHLGVHLDRKRISEKTSLKSLGIF